MTLRSTLELGGYYLAQAWSGWPIKIPLATLGSLYATYIGGDWIFLLIYFVFFTLDLLFGTWLAIKEERFELRRFSEWVVKVGSHFFTIFVVGISLKSILGPLNVTFSWLDLCIGLLICTEAASILKRMHELGLPVPKIAVKLLSHAQLKAERAAEDLLKSEDSHDHQN